MVLAQPAAKSGQFLHGEISHSDSLPPVNDASLQPGNVIDKCLLSPALANLDWHVIPEWYAGHWRVSEETITSYRDYRTGQDKTMFDKIRNEVDWLSGSEKDASGQIWNCKQVPYTSTVTLSNEIDYFHERKLDYLDVEANKVVIQETGYQINTDPESGRIISVLQDEAIHSYVPINDGEMQENISKKVFDATGQALFKRTVTRQVFRDKSFMPSSSLMSSFIEFLNAHGLRKLVPVAPTS